MCFLQTLHQNTISQELKTFKNNTIIVLVTYSLSWFLRQLPLCTIIREPYGLWKVSSFGLLQQLHSFSSASVHRLLGWPRKRLLHHSCLLWINDIYEDNCTLEVLPNLHKKLNQKSQERTHIQMQTEVFCWMLSLKDLSQERSSGGCGGSCGAHMEPVYCYNGALLPHRMVFTTVVFTDSNNEHIKYVVLNGVNIIQSISQLFPRRIIFWS